MSKETVYKCDRCSSRDKEQRQRIVLANPIGVYPALKEKGRKQFDLCKPCSDALARWLEKDNATMPGGRGPGWEEVCHHHVPCGGPCADPSWKQVR